jgi:PPOX class probable F420-dependent enzyme
VALGFTDVIKSKYLLLTTFTKDGRPKPTPIWGVPDGDKLLVITDDGSWKVRRITNTPRVTIARSAALGKTKSDPVEGVAQVLPKSETRRVYNAVLKRYWLRNVKVCSDPRPVSCPVHGCAPPRRSGAGGRSRDGLG